MEEGECEIADGIEDFRRNLVKRKKHLSTLQSPQARREP
jgi:hypothetical protein